MWVIVLEIQIEKNLNIFKYLLENKKTIFLNINNILMKITFKTKIDFNGDSFNALHFWLHS